MEDANIGKIIQHPAREQWQVGLFYDLKLIVHLNTICKSDNVN
jgi:hypothetical protein